MVAIIYLRDKSLSPGGIYTRSISTAIHGISMAKKLIAMGGGCPNEEPEPCRGFRRGS
jgi:hypothetical protein